MERICRVLAVTYRFDGGGNGTVIEAAGAALLVSVADRHKGVRSTACTLLNTFGGVAACEANRAPLVAAGLIPFAIAAVGLHAADDAREPSNTVVRAAALLFRELVRSADARKVLIAAGVIPLLVGSLPSRAYLDGNSGWLTFIKICESLVALAEDNASNRLAVVAAGAIPPMIGALGGMPQIVVSSSSDVLCELSKSPAGAAAIVAGGGVAPLFSHLSNTTITADISWEPTTTAMRMTLAACMPHSSAEERALIVAALGRV